MSTEPFALVLSSIKAATDIAKLITNSSHNLEKAELNLKLAEIITNLADAKIEMTNTKELLNQKDSEIKELKEALSFKEKLTFRDNVYRDDQNGAYCSRCWTKDKTPMRLICPNPQNENYFKCPECENTFQTKEGQKKDKKLYTDAMNW